jgi:hypothetical protein
MVYTFVLNLLYAIKALTLALLGSLDVLIIYKIDLEYIMKLLSKARRFWN